MGLTTEYAVNEIIHLIKQMEEAQYGGSTKFVKKILKYTKEVHEEFETRSHKTERSHKQFIAGRYK